CVTAYSNYGYW
nr:immunoglobulin heavy chain junction region [Mus musculus]